MGGSYSAMDCIFLNQADRQAFNIVLPEIQNIFGANVSTMGLIAMLFNIF